MNNKRFAIRMRKELEVFILDPPHGISCCTKADDPLIIEAAIIGPEGTPYEGGIFHLEIQLPDNYPFYPPRVRFLTRIYHPNIDEEGRICLDLLKAPPSGSWRCTNSIANVLIAIQCLMSAPNPSDPLCPDIADKYFNDREFYEKTAREFTEKYAQSATPPSVSGTMPVDSSENKTTEEKQDTADDTVPSSTMRLSPPPAPESSSNFESPESKVVSQPSEESNLDVAIASENIPTSSKREGVESSDNEDPLCKKPKCS